MGAPDFMLGTTRSMFTMMQFTAGKNDYATSLAGLQEGTTEYDAALNACHVRGAERCAKVAEMHRGLYVKAAQFISSISGGTGDSGIPKAYTEALSKFTDRAPHKKIEEVAESLKECMKLPGSWPREPSLLEAGPQSDLQSIDSEPLAAASLAQVHLAVLRDGRKVAIKVQYPELRKEMASDFAVFKTLGSEIKKMSQGYDLLWAVEDFQRNLQRELDFQLEAKNCEDTAAQLAHLAPRVFVPKVFKELSSSSVLVMEFCDNLLKATDPSSLQAAGLDVDECARLISDTFAEMIFVHGRVHADPHAGNIYLRAVDLGSGRLQPQLVLLDHGLYHDLHENGVRLNFCRYWQACCANDSVAINIIGQRLSGGLRRFLPLILSHWFVFGRSGVSISELVSAAKGQLPDTVTMKEVADFIVAAREGGANLVGLLHSLGFTRGLLNALGFPEEGRIASMLKYALLGDSPEDQAVPPELSLSQKTWLGWRVLLLRSQVQWLAPLGQPFMACPGENNNNSKDNTTTNNNNNNNKNNNNQGGCRCQFSPFSCRGASGGAAPEDAAEEQTILRQP
ncbi:unnamed protein product [Polarella glacialis]|nr:unnamed protein product [Polarella glacialis]